MFHYMDQVPGGRHRPVLGAYARHDTDRLALDGQFFIVAQICFNTDGHYQESGMRSVI